MGYALLPSPSYTALAWRHRHGPPLSRQRYKQKEGKKVEKIRLVTRIMPKITGLGKKTELNGSERKWDWILFVSLASLFVFAACVTFTYICVKTGLADGFFIVITRTIFFSFSCISKSDCSKYGVRC